MTRNHQHAQDGWAKGQGPVAGHGDCACPHSHHVAADWILPGLPVDVDWTLHAWAERSHAAAWACDDLTPGQAAAAGWAGWWMQCHCYAVLRSKQDAPDLRDLQVGCRESA